MATDIRRVHNIAIETLIFCAEEKCRRRRWFSITNSISPYNVDSFAYELPRTREEYLLMTDLYLLTQKQTFL